MYYANTCSGPVTGQNSKNNVHFITITMLTLHETNSRMNPPQFIRDHRHHSPDRNVHHYKVEVCVSLTFLMFLNFPNFHNQVQTTLAMARRETEPTKVSTSTFELLIQSNIVALLPNLHLSEYY